MNPDNPMFRTPEEERRAEEFVCMCKELATARKVIEKLYSALSVSRGQWIHSVNKDQCLEALAEIERLK